VTQHADEYGRVIREENIRAERVDRLTLVTAAKMKGFMFAAALIAATGGIGFASAQTYPSRPIKVVVPFGAGGFTFTLAHLLADQIGATRGLTIMVESRPGAGTVIGTEAVSRAAPDGNTLLINTPAIIINSHLRKVNYDPLGSFEPICNLGRLPSIIAVGVASPYRTLADLLNAARAKPGQLTLASVGPATTTHLAFEMLSRATKVNISFVPFSGSPAVVNALLGQHVTSALTDYPILAEHLKAGKLRALATATRTRIEPLPDVPTVAESGYEGFEADVWLGLFAPARTPEATASRLAGWFTAALQVPDIKSKLAAIGVFPDGRCGVDFAAYLRKQYDDYGRIIREANINTE
jgi:tripartite-type tricarboxylate transporter receptor subunit TctC